MQLSRRSLLITTSQAVVVATLAPLSASAKYILQSDDIQSGGTLSFATTVDADSMDPHESVGLAARERQALVYDRLVYRDADGTFQPWLAESWDVSEDEKEITFKIVTDRQFTDGTPVNAEAVKYTFDRMLEPDRASSAATQFPQMQIDVVDEFTARFVLGEPFAPFFNSLCNPAGGIISPTAAEASGTDFGQNPVGSGPFLLESWTKDTEMVLAKNTDYSTIRGDFNNKGPAHIDQLIYQIVVEDNTRVNAIQTGDVQIAVGSYTLASLFENNSEVELLVSDVGSANINYLGLNQRKAPFDDVLVRRAVGYAVNAQEIVDLAYFGYATLNQSMLPTGVAGHNPALGEEYGFTYDPDTAKSLLDEAGWIAPEGKSIREKDGNPLEVELLSWTSSRIDTVTQLIQAQLADVGIDVKINLMEAGTFLAVGVEGDQNFDFNRTTWDEPVILSRTLEGGGNFKNFESSELDELLETSATTLDWEKRQEILDQANQLVLEQALAIPLLTDFDVFLVRSNVKDFAWDASGWEKMTDVWLEQ